MYVRLHFFFVVVLSLVSTRSLYTAAAPLNPDYSDKNTFKRRLSGTDFIRGYEVPTFSNLKTYVGIMEPILLNLNFPAGKLNEFMKTTFSNDIGEKPWFRDVIKEYYSEGLEKYEQTISEIKDLKERTDGKSLDVSHLYLFKKGTKDVDALIFLGDTLGTLCSFGKAEKNDAIIDAACMTTVDMVDDETSIPLLRSYSHPFAHLVSLLHLRSLTACFERGLQPYVKAVSRGEPRIIKAQLSDCYSQLVLNTQGYVGDTGQVFEGAFCKQKDKPLVVYTPRTVISNYNFYNSLAIKIDNFGNWYTNDLQLGDKRSFIRTKAIIYRKAPTWNISVFDSKRFLLTSEIEGVSSRLFVYPKDTSGNWHFPVVGVVRPSISFEGFHLDAYSANALSNIPDGSYGTLDFPNFRCQQLPSVTSISGVYEPAVVKSSVFKSTILFKDGLQCILRLASESLKEPEDSENEVEPRDPMFLIIFDDANARVATLMSKNPVSKCFLSSADPPDPSIGDETIQLKKQLEKDLQDGVLMPNLFRALEPLICYTVDNVEPGVHESVYKLVLDPNNPYGFNPGQVTEFAVNTDCDVDRVKNMRGSRVFYFEHISDLTSVAIFPEEIAHLWSAIIPSIERMPVVDSTASSVRELWGRSLPQFVTLWPLFNCQDGYAYSPVKWSKQLLPYYFVDRKDALNLADHWTTKTGEHLNFFFGRRTGYWKLFVTTMYDGSKIGIPTVISNSVYRHLEKGKDVVLKMLPMSRTDRGRQQIVCLDEELHVIGNKVEILHQISGGELFYDDDAKLYQIEDFPIYVDGVTAKIGVNEVDAPKLLMNLTIHTVLVNESGSVTPLRKSSTFS